MTSEIAPKRAALAVVAEDEPVLRLEMSDTLADAGFEVLEASTAIDALYHLSTHPGIGLLVTDVQMPGTMDGFALAREAAERCPGLRIVICSAYAKPQAGQMPDGARFLDKPYSADLVTSLLREMGVPARG